MDTTAIVLALISFFGSALALYFGYKQQVARLAVDVELISLKARVKDAEDDLIATKKELEDTKRELIETRQELVETKSRVKDLEKHNGTLETEKKDWTVERRALLEENAELKARASVVVKQRPRREL